MNPLPWIILFLPLVAAAFITLFTGRNRALSAGLSIGAVLAGFVLSLILVGSTGWDARLDSQFTWLAVDTLHVDFGIRLDPLSLLMMLMVTGVAGAIHVYSWGYMREDPGFSRFFACLSLFTFSMLGIVLANNFIELFIFWELVGVSSYLLIGFWFERPAAADAGKKAFLTNRLGDLGFLLGILTVWLALHSLNFSVLEEALKKDPRGPRPAGHGGRAADLLRRGGQERPIPAACLAARRHGRPYARQRPHSRRHHGGRRRLYALPGFLPARPVRACR